MAKVSPNDLGPPTAPPSLPATCNVCDSSRAVLLMRGRERETDGLTEWVMPFAASACAPILILPRVLTAAVLPLVLDSAPSSCLFLGSSLQHSFIGGEICLAIPEEGGLKEEAGGTLPHLLLSGQIKMTRRESVSVFPFPMARAALPLKVALLMIVGDDDDTGKK